MTYLHALFAIICIILSLIIHSGDNIGNTRYHLASDNRTFPNTWKCHHRALPTQLMNITFIVVDTGIGSRLNDKFTEVYDDTSPQYRQFLSHDEIQKFTNFKPDHIEAVDTWLKKSNINNYTNIGSHFYVTEQVQTIEKLLHTLIYEFTYKNVTTVYATHLTYSIPLLLKDIIIFIDRLDAAFLPTKIRRKALSNSNVKTIINIPQTIGSMYNISTIGQSKKIGNTSIGVVQFGAAAVDLGNQKWSLSSNGDLSSFASLTGIVDKTPNIITYPFIDAHNNTSSSFNNDANLEATLDLEYMSLSSAQPWLWLEDDQNVWLYDFIIQLYTTNVNQGKWSTKIPDIISISYGWLENSQCDGTVPNTLVDNQCKLFKIYIDLINNQIMQLGLMGKTIIVASGDDGANGPDGDCTNSKFYSLFPASSPYVTSVGATELTKPFTTINSISRNNIPPICDDINICINTGTEIAASFETSGFTSGGGFSNYSPAQSWQLDVIHKYLTSNKNLPSPSYYDRTGRGYPDVSVLGSNMFIVYRNESTTVGGTSVAAPIFAVLMSEINEYLFANKYGPLGFLNPFLYSMAANCLNCFADITIGDNKSPQNPIDRNKCSGFTAGPGWDPVSGLGTPNYGNILAYVKRKFPPLKK
jgi:tripeptidyl-peptidase-1